MIDVQDVLTRLEALLAAGAGEAEEFRPLCAASAAEIAAKLRPGADHSDPRLTEAAAALAFYRAAAVSGGSGSAVSFRAGDVAVTTGGKDRIQAAATLRDAAMAGISDLLADEGFAFFRC